MKILVTTPTGTIGRRIVPELLAPEFSVRVITPDSSGLPAEVRENVEVILGSTDDEETLLRALDGAEALFWCVPTESLQETNVERHYERFACAAWHAIRLAGTPRVVTISAGGKDLARNASPISGLHAMEEILNESGAAIRHLRCGFLMENFLSQVRSIYLHGLLSLPIPGHIPLPLVAATDIAEAALWWLVRRDWGGIEGKALHGPEDLSCNQAAAVLERLFERPVRYQEAAANHYIQMLLGLGASAEYAESQVGRFAELACGITRAEPRTAESTTPTTLAVWAETELRSGIESLRAKSTTAGIPIQRQNQVTYEGGNRGQRPLTGAYFERIESARCAPSPANSWRRQQHPVRKAMKKWITLLLVGGFAVRLSADDQLAWPQFRGPNGSGVADGQKPPVEFGPDKNVNWKVPVPSGLSSPIVAGDKLVITAFDGGKLYTIAYDRASGKEVWRADAMAKQLEAYYKAEGSPAASTPVTDGQRVVSYFGSCGLICYDLAGKELWKFEMPPAATPGDFGSGVSPIIADHTVILVRDETKEPRILALDAVTGSLKWQKPRQSRASYCTPVVWDTPSGKQIVAAGHARMIGYELGSGEEAWSVTGIPSGCCSSPVTADGVLFFAGWSPGGPDDKEMQMPTYDSMLKDLDANKDGALSREEGEKAFQGFFDNQDANKDGKVTRDEWDMILKFMSEGKNSAFALKSGGTGDVTSSHVLWMKTKGLPYIASAIVYRGQYIMVKDGGIVTAYDTKTGTEIYQERLPANGKYYSSPVAANGHIYFTTLNDGTITVLKAGSDKPEVVATNPKLGERTAATPAIAEDALFVRTDRNLYAFAAEK